MAFRLMVAPLLAATLAVTAAPAVAQEPSASPDSATSAGPVGAPLPFDPEAVVVSTGPTESAAADAEATLVALLLEQSGLADALDPDALAMVTALLGGAGAPGGDGASVTLLAAAGVPDVPTPATADLAGAASVGAMVGAMAAMQGAIGSGYERDGTTAPPAVTEQGATEADGVRTAASSRTSVRVTRSGSMVVVDADSSLEGTQTNVATGVQVGRFSQRTEIQAEVEGCPDADGVAALQLSGEVTMDASGMPGGGGVAIALDQDRRGCVGEDAYLRSGDDSLDLGVEVSPPGGGPTRSVSVQGSITMGRTAGGGPDPSNLSGRMTVQDNPGGFTDADILGYYKAIGLLLAFVAETAFDRAEEQWRDGACVRIDSTEPSNREVQPSEQVTINAKPMHRLEGTELEKTVVGSLAGEGTLDPADTPQEAPAQLSYEAADEEGKTGTVTLTSTSNRGIGTLVTTFRVDPGRYELKVSGQFAFKGLIPFGDLKGTISGVVRDIKPGAGADAGEGSVRVAVEQQYRHPRLRLCTLRKEATGGSLVMESPRSAPEDRTVRLKLDVRDQFDRLRMQCGPMTQMVGLEGEGGLGHFWSEPMVELVFPLEGGRRKVSGSRSFPGGLSSTAKGTVTLRRQRS